MHTNVVAQAARASARQSVETRTLFWPVFALVACVAALPFWVGEYLPLADLPQHAAQLAIGEHWHDASLHYADYYRINPYTNQRLGYEITRLFALVLPLTYALKCLLTLAVWSFAASVYWLVRTIDGDRWWSLLAFPTAFSFSLYWGLLNYIVSLPLGICLIVVSTRYALAPARWRAFFVLVTAHVLFLSHALILAYSGLVCVGVVLARAPRRRAKLLGCAALASVLPAVAIWWSAIRTHEASTAATFLVGSYGPERIPRFFSYQVSSAEGTWPEVLIGFALFAAPLAFGARPSREPWRWLPFTLTAGLFFALPAAALDIDMLYGRVTTFALPAMLFALEARSARSWHHGVIAAAALARLAFLVVQFHAFDAEAQPLNRVLAAAQPGKRLLYLPVNNRSAFVPHEVYSHFGCFYQIKNGGIADYSFAELFPTWFRYRPNVEPNLPLEFDSNAQNFRYEQHDGKLFDYLLVRGPVLDAWFAGAQVTATVVSRASEWTLLRVESAPVHAAAAERGS